MYPRPTLKSQLPGLILAILGFNLPSASGAPLVGAIEFNSNCGDFTVVSTNNPGGPWEYDAVRGSWRAFDTNDCGAVAFRSSRLNSPTLTVATAGSVTLSFSHRYSFEVDTTRWDGGQLRISVNQGAYVAVPLASFSANGYNNTVGGASVPNCELAGQQAFTAQSTGYVAEEYTISIATLGTFNANDTISIQVLGAWDDCAQGSVPNWEIDRVEFSPPLEDRRSVPSFSAPALPADATVVEGSSHTLRATPAGQIYMQWFKDMVLIPGATGSNYTIGRMTMADAGHYFLRAGNAIGSSTSRVATVSFQPDTTPPAYLSARCGAVPGEFTIRLSEPLEPDNGLGYAVTDPFLWNIETVTGPGANPGPPVDIRYTNGDTVIYMTAQAGTLDFSLNTYRVVNVEILIDTAVAHNALPANSSVPLKCPMGIVVGSTGAGPYTFDTLPPVTEFSTLTWAGAANGTADNAAIVGARAQLLDASTINVALGAAAGAPPAAAGVAQWASVGQNLITRPTGVSGCVIMARLQNDSGAPRTALNISYNLLAQNPVVEEVPGHLVYYSLTGAPSQWQPIPGISGDGSTGLKSATLNLSATPWTVGSVLYLLWVDDNGSGSPDSANQIDNFSVSFPRPALTISYSSPNVRITWTAGSGVLQSKSTLTAASWTDVPGAGSSGSATIAAGGPRQFFSLRAP